ncbi:hypothetical protein NLM24_25835 [Nocardia zapadnayensis]|uniref:hypothetical protein n=1 Tax=Nocardia rhamnosiphila TaxID=426716 RepID=UPI002245748C|nr:hypothetical protein [Nocardia zapadnayensis]MCX0274050.1 hypothetical protein [Nocardia zapadnayensis]
MTSFIGRAGERARMGAGAGGLERSGGVRGVDVPGEFVAHGDEAGAGAHLGESGVAEIVLDEVGSS